MSFGVVVSSLPEGLEILLAGCRFDVSTSFVRRANIKFQFRCDSLQSGVPLARGPCHVTLPSRSTMHTTGHFASPSAAPEETTPASISDGTPSHPCLRTEMDLREAHHLLLDFLHQVSSSFQKLPGSAILLRYVRSSYQNDPVRSAVELFLFLFFIRYLLAPSYSPRAKGGTHVALAEEVRGFRLMLPLRSCPSLSTGLDPDRDMRWY